MSFRLAATHFLLACGLMLPGAVLAQDRGRGEERGRRPDQGREVTCESAGRYRRCEADTRRGIRLVRQLSQAACTQGRSWGYEADYIWVNNGCRAVFEVGDPVAGGGERVTCASAGRRVRCRADTRQEVRLVRQLSDAECREGSTWGTDPGFIWVDRGCRAEFLVGRGDSGRQETVQCESRGGFTRCEARFTRRGVRLVRQLSQAACTEDVTWGYDRNGIWVDNGCRGIFEAGDPVAGAGERVTCASDGSFYRCPADTDQGIRLVRQLSRAPCTPGESWGYDRGHIWVDRGCRAEFRVGGGFAPIRRR